MTCEARVYYFGCRRGEIGHYWQGRGDVDSLYGPAGGPGIIDGKYPPRVGPDRRRRPDQYDSRPEVPQGQAALVHVSGWTVIAYWDRSQDKRGASNSAFAAEGECSFAELLEAARRQWPWVFERQAFEVVEIRRGAP